MDKTQLYVIIAVLAVLTVVLVWMGVKMIADIRKRERKLRNRQSRRNKKS